MVAGHSIQNAKLLAAVTDPFRPVARYSVIVEMIKTIVRIIASVLLICGECSSAEVRVLVTAGFNIELTEEEKDAIDEAPKELIANPSRFLAAAIEAGEMEAILLDQRGNAREKYPLMLILTYPTVSVNEFRTVRPVAVCEGSIFPAVWDYCRENSDTSIIIPNHGRIYVNHESITKESAEQMLAFLDAADLESPKGAPIAGKGVHNILYRERIGLYSLTGDTAKREHFSIKIRPISGGGATNYEITDWSCQ